MRKREERKTGLTFSMSLRRSEEVTSEGDFGFMGLSLIREQLKHLILHISQRSHCKIKVGGSIQNIDVLICICDESDT